MKKLLSILILAGMLSYSTAFAAVTFPINGGTGSSTLTGILIGNGTSPVNSLIVGSNLNLTGTTLSAPNGAPGGLNTQLQYNNVGAFGGVSGATTNGTILSLTNPLLGGATLTTSSVNGVTLTTGGGTTTFLNANGAYSTPLGTVISGTQGQNVYIGPAGTAIATSTIFITPAGFTGIGTTTPGATLDVVNTTGTNVAQFTNLGFGGSGGGAGLLGHTGFVPTATGDRLGFLLFGFTNGVAGSIGTNAVGIDGYADQAWTLGTNQGSYLDFETTADNSTARTERMRIAANGNVGIGTTSPSQILSVAGGELLSGTLTLSALGGTQCLHEIAGVVSGTGSDCGSGGGGTNFFTSDGVSTTYLNNNPILAAPSFNATSTLATSTFAGDVWIGSNGVRPNPDLRIGTSSLPLYGRVLGDVIDAEYDYNGVTSINVANANIGTCAASTYFADGNNPTLGGYYATFSFLNDGWTNGGGAGCGIGVSNTDKPEALALVSPTGEFDNDIASSSAAAGFADFNWNVNNVTKMKLTNAGSLGIGTTSPFATLSIQTPAAAPSVQQNCIFAIASTTAAGAITQMSYCNGTTATSEILAVDGALNLTGGNGATAGIDFAGTAKISINASQTTFSQGAGSASSWLYSPPATTGLGTTANIPYISFDPTSVNRGHASGAIAEQDDFQITAAQNSFASGAANVSTIGTSTAVAINGIPNIEIRGASANSFGLLLNATTTLNASTTNSYALGVMTSSGATNNYAAEFLGGNVGVGTTSPWLQFSTTGRVALSGLTPSSGLQTGVLCLSSSNEVINDSIACLASAKRYKEDITDFSPSTALSQILALNPVTYLYKKDFNGAFQSNPNYSRTQLGLIADDVGKVNPAFEVVETATTTFEGKTYAPGSAAAVDYNEIDAALVGAVKAEQVEILALKVPVTRDLEDNWQNAAIAVLGFLFAAYVIYNEVDKRRK